MTTNSEKKEMSLAEFIVIVVIVGVLMAVFINFYIKNESQFRQAGFATIAQTFNTKVNAVHAQWMMDKQPPDSLCGIFVQQKKTSSACE